METIKLTEFLSSKKILHIDLLDSPGLSPEMLRTFIDLVEPSLDLFGSGDAGVDAFTFDHTEYFSSPSSNLSKSEDALLNFMDVNRNYYNHLIPHDCDMIDNVRIEGNINGILSYFIGGKEYDFGEFSELVLVSAPYTNFHIRIRFQEKMVVNDGFRISYRCFLFKEKDRRRLLSCNLIKDRIIYTNGCVLERFGYGSTVKVALPRK